MSLNDPVFKILISKGDQALLAKEKKVSDLIPGQIGVFNKLDNKSVDKDIENLRDFYIAVGVGQGDEFETFEQSAGEVIPTRNLRDYSLNEASVGTPTLAEIEGFPVYTNKEYYIVIELTSKEISTVLGAKPYIKRYTYSKRHKKDVQTNWNAFIYEFYKKINSDNLFKVQLYKPNGTEIVGTTAIENYLKVAANKSPASVVYAKLKITPLESKLKDISDINLKYFYPRNIKMLCNIYQGEGTIIKKATVEDYKASQGSGYDIRQKEYYSNNWNGDQSPYKLHSAIGASQNKKPYLSDIKKKYDQVVLNYDLKIYSSGVKYINNLTTIVAIERNEEVKTTLDELLGVLDAITSSKSFKKLAPEPEAENQNA